MTNNRISALIVDDEPHARKLLQLLLSENCPTVDVLGTCSSSKEASKFLSQQKPQVLFLDIEMPEQDGISFLRGLDTVGVYPVFTTSHAEYALDAVKAHAFDYLLKPIDPEDLKACMASIGKRVAAASHIHSSPSNKEKVALKNVKSTVYIDQSEIIAVKASGSYSEIVTKHGVKVVSKNLRSMEESLNPLLFYRIHNSTLLNMKEVQEIIHTGNYAVMSNGERYIISTRKKDEFVKRMGLQ